MLEQMCNQFLCLGLFTCLTATSICNFSVPSKFAEFCALSTVACVLVRLLILLIFLDCKQIVGYTVTQLFELLQYKPEGHGFNSL